MKSGDTRNYKVGYGKPPTASQFQKGVSGNPKGRPKNQSTFDSILKKEVNSQILVTENGKRKRISKMQAVAKVLVNNAVKGGRSDLKMLIARLSLWENEIPTETSGSTFRDGLEANVKEFEIPKTREEVERRIAELLSKPSSKIVKIDSEETE
ncbi:DUF5681 domain-containing protein [Granulicella sp. L46]|uniref:DUF5681 domain-containing protein n=1 Tax=Granulicella sp. L46 TaxID=1641865 RepID=UPI00131CBC82|nr:DUF5681 domain-containing protein [Granulicella sp. L46]